MNTSQIYSRKDVPVTFSLFDGKLIMIVKVFLNAQLTIFHRRLDYRPYFFQIIWEFLHNPFFHVPHSIGRLAADKALFQKHVTR